GEIDRRLNDLRAKAAHMEATEPSDVKMKVKDKWISEGAHGTYREYWLTPEERRERAALVIEMGRLTENQSRGVPSAPFSKSWHELAMKRMLRFAAEHGYDKLGWTTGDMQNERYDLSKQVSRILLHSNTKNDIGAPLMLSAFDKNGTQIMNKGVFDESEIADYI